MSNKSAVMKRKFAKEFQKCKKVLQEKGYNKSSYQTMKSCMETVQKKYLIDVSKKKLTVLALPQKRIYEMSLKELQRKIKLKRKNLLKRKLAQVKFLMGSYNKIEEFELPGPDHINKLFSNFKGNNLQNIDKLISNIRGILKKLKLIELAKARELEHVFHDIISSLYEKKSHLNMKLRMFAVEAGREKVIGLEKETLHQKTCNSVRFKDKPKILTTENRFEAMSKPNILHLKIVMEEYGQQMFKNIKSQYEKLEETKKAISDPEKLKVIDEKMKVLCRKKINIEKKMQSVYGSLGYEIDAQDCSMDKLKCFEKPIEKKLRPAKVSSRMNGQPSEFSLKLMYRKYGKVLVEQIESRIKSLGMELKKTEINDKKLREDTSSAKQKKQLQLNSEKIENLKKTMKDLATKKRMIETSKLKYEIMDEKQENLRIVQEFKKNRDKIQMELLLKNSNSPYLQKNLQFIDQQIHKLNLENAKLDKKLSNLEARKKLKKSAKGQTGVLGSDIEKSIENYTEKHLRETLREFGQIFTRNIESNLQKLKLNFDNLKKDNKKTAGEVEIKKLENKIQHNEEFLKKCMAILNDLKRDKKEQISSSKSKTSGIEIMMSNILEEPALNKGGNIKENVYQKLAQPRFADLEFAYNTFNRFMTDEKKSKIKQILKERKPKSK